MDRIIVWMKKEKKPRETQIKRIKKKKIRKFSTKHLHLPTHLYRYAHFFSVTLALFHFILLFFYFKFFYLYLFISFAHSHDHFCLTMRIGLDWIGLDYIRELYSTRTLCSVLRSTELATLFVCSQILFPLPRIVLFCESSCIFCVWPACKFQHRLFVAFS